MGEKEQGTLKCVAQVINLFTTEALSTQRGGRYPSIKSMT